MTDRTVIVGGGIAGASVAFHLSRASDREVVVYDRGELAGETTARSAAFFGFYGSDVERPMKRYGLSLYNDFFRDPRADPYYDLVGRVDVSTTPDGARDLESTAARTRDRGDAVEFVSGGHLDESFMLPELDTALVEGASYRPQVGYLRPREMALEFVERARDRGVAFEPHTTVDDLVIENGRIAGVVAEGETIDAAHVVCAAGPWNPTLCDMAGIDLPATHDLAPILKLRRDGARHTMPIVSHVESGVYVRGNEDGTALVGYHPTGDPDSTIDPDGVDDEIPDDIRAEMRRVVGDLLPGLADAEAVDEWVGVRSHTPDGNPIAGPTPVEGLSVASFDTSGIQLSPAVGRVIGQHIAGEAAPSFASDLLLSRFSD